MDVIIDIVSNHDKWAESLLISAIGPLNEIDYYMLNLLNVITNWLAFKKNVNDKYETHSASSKTACNKRN